MTKCNVNAYTKPAFPDPLEQARVMVMTEPPLWPQHSIIQPINKCLHSRCSKNAFCLPRFGCKTTPEKIKAHLRPRTEAGMSDWTELNCPQVISNPCSNWNDVLPFSFLSFFCCFKNRGLDIECFKILKWKQFTSIVSGIKCMVCY